MGVGVGEAQLVGQRIQEQVAPLSVEVARQPLEHIHRRSMHHRLRALQRLRRLCMRATVCKALVFKHATGTIWKQEERLVTCTPAAAYNQHSVLAQFCRA